MRGGAARDRSDTTPTGSSPSASSRPTPVDHVVAEVAARQHGIVALDQLLDAGMTAAMVRSRTARGWFHRVHRGVYAVGHPPRSRQARWLAAVWACGAAALLSHRSAAMLWRIRESASGLIEVVSPTGSGRSRDGIRVHTTRSLPAADRTILDAIPVTTLERTIVDLATVVHAQAVEYAIHRAEHQRRLRLEALEQTARRLTGHPGAAVVLRLIDAADPLASQARGGAERRFLAICREHRIPPPLVNRWIALPIAAGGVEADFCWPAKRLVVELDDRATHTTSRAFGNDRARDRALLQAGWRPLRFPAEETRTRPGGIAAEVLDALAQAHASARPG